MNIGTKWDYVGLTEKEVLNQFDGYYIYLHIYIPTNEIWYVGKGCRRRSVSFNRREYYDEYLKGNIEVDIIYRTNDEEQAFEQEKFEIYYHKLLGQAKYNSSNYHKGKVKEGIVDKKIEGEKEMVIDTEVTYELDSLDYSYCNEFDIHKDIKFENVKLNKMELNTIRDLEYRNNIDSFMSNLSSKSYDEVRDMFTFAQQNLSNENISLRNTYLIVRKYLKKYF